MDNNETLVELKKISNYLALLSIEPMKKLLTELKQKKLLTTEQRTKMFLLIDGERTTLEIAKKVGIGQRGAQHFMKELEGKGLIRLERKGIAFVPVKDYEKIVEFIKSE